MLHAGLLPDPRLHRGIFYRGSNTGSRVFDKITGHRFGHRDGALGFAFGTVQTASRTGVGIVREQGRSCPKTDPKQSRITAIKNTVGRG